MGIKQDRSKLESTLPNLKLKTISTQELNTNRVRGEKRTYVLAFEQTIYARYNDTQTNRSSMPDRTN